MDIQARIPTALCAIHNFIRTHDVQEESVYRTGDGPHYDNDDYHDDGGFDGVDPAEINADARRDGIAQMMWEQYQHICAERDDSDETTDETSDDSEETDNNS